MKKIVITYIGGGSKDWAHKYFSDLLTQSDLCGELRLYDIDFEAAERNRKYFDKLKKDNATLLGSEWNCSVTEKIDEALPGSDFVVISILPYSLKNMHVDVHYPEKYGIIQSVGDTVGPGGYSRALRTIPAFQFFGQKIKEHCPDAWVINYTNPLAMCINTLYRAFPEIKAFGCCHEVFGAQKILAEVKSMYDALSENGKKAFMEMKLTEVQAELERMGKDFSVRSFYTIRRQDIKINVQGINHFTWINKAEHNGEDLLPYYNAFIKMFRYQNDPWQSEFRPSFLGLRHNVESVKFELFERYGVVAAAGDRHLAEFIPLQFLTSRKVMYNGFILTPVFGRVINDKARKLLTKYYGSPISKAKFKTSGEEGVKQIAAICGFGDMFTNINMPNRSQAPSIVSDTAVETNATLSENSVIPADSGEMAEEVAEMVNVHARNQKDFVDAYFAKDKAKLCEVFCRDPAVERIGKEKGEKLFEEMIHENRECLEGFLLE